MGMPSLSTIAPVVTGMGWASGAISGIEKDQQARLAGQRANRQRAEDIGLQKEFAQHGIRWKVEDAMRAGIHPLYALGAQGATYSPVGSVGGPGYSSNFADSLQSMGQDVSRAFMSTRTQDERSKKMMDLQLENQSLQNDLLRSQVARQNSAQLGPGMPNTVINAAQVTASSPGFPGQEAGKVSDVGFAQTATGLVPVPSKDVKERIEDNFFQEAAHAYRNNLLPNFKSGLSEAPSRALLPKGFDYWEWSRSRQEWQPRAYPKGVLYRSDDY